jgi:hypothetical protein
VRAFESRRRDGRATFELELILRTAWVSLVTGGVTLDMLQSLSVEMYRMLMTRKRKRGSKSRRGAVFIERCKKQR